MLLNVLVGLYGKTSGFAMGFTLRGEAGYWLKFRGHHRGRLAQVGRGDDPGQAAHDHDIHAGVPGDRPN